MTRLLVLLSIAWYPFPVLAGTFLGSAGHLSSSCGGSPCSNFIIVHPVGYTSAGIGGELEIPICIEPGEERLLRAPVENAIAIWNALNPMMGNCRDCGTADEPFREGVQLLDTVVLHELGHCAMGLDHSNYQAPMADDSVNFTSGTEVNSYSEGADGIRGSRDDVVTPNPGPPPPNALMTHWYRLADNNPVVIDGTVIDATTFSLIWALLPAGSNWPASANRFVAESLGAGDDTQSVMHAAAVRNMLYVGISADDSNTVRHAMSGLDAQAGTADDYTIRLVLVNDCADAEIEVRMSDLEETLLGDCLADVTPIDPEPPPLGSVHHALQPIPMLFPRITVRINENISWGIFADSFESGDLSRWAQR